MLLAIEETLPVVTPVTGDTHWDLAISIGVPVLITLLRAVLSKHASKIPKYIWPLLTPLLGLVTGALLNGLTAANLTPEQMAKAGALAVFLREVVDQLLKSFRPKEADKAN